MKIHILGSCSGTEPMPGRHHTAWILETSGKKNPYNTDPFRNGDKDKRGDPANHWDCE